MYTTRCNVTQFIYIWKLLYMFRVYLHPSSGAQTTVSTASGICQTDTATCRYRGRVGTGLSVLWVEYVGRGRSGQALPPPRSYGKPEAAAAAAVERLLIMGKRMPDTC
jgi:hypothetical protein